MAATIDFPSKFYEEINNVIGGSNPNEKLTLLLPGIALTKSDFAYDYKNNEPKGPVIEANESRLANKLYDLAEVVGGDNGKTLEHQYKSALDMLTPKVNPILAKAKNQLRDLLMKPFPYKFGPKNIKRAEIWDRNELKTPPQSNTEEPQSSDTTKYTFQEVFFRLYNDYVEQLGEWANERQRRKEYYFKLAEGKNFENEAQKNKWYEDQYLQWFEDNGESWLAAVNQKMSVLLSVFSDNDMKIIEGILDSGFGAELQEARQTLRNFRKINPDGGYIYPVKFNPTNWFEYLDTSFTPVDLVNSPAAILDQLRLLYKKRNYINKRILDITSEIKTSDKKLTEAKQAIKKAKKEFEECDSALEEAVHTSFTDFAKFAAVTICKIKCPPASIEKLIEKDLGKELPAGEVKNSLKDKPIEKRVADNNEDFKKLNVSGDDNLLEAAMRMKESQKDSTQDVKIDNNTIKEIKGLDIPTTINEGLNTLVEGTNRVNLAQHVYLNTINNYTNLLSKNNENSVINQSLKNEISTLVMEKQNVESDIQDLEDRLNAVKASDIEKCFSDAVNPPAVPEGFTQLTISHDVSSASSHSLTTSSSSTSTSDSGFWIFRKKTRSSQSQSSTESHFENKAFKIEIGMNVAKVGIEREWFNPGIFALTEEMYSVAETTDDKQKKLYIAEYEDKDSTKKVRIPKGSGVFPCYPTAMVIARDVTIRLTSSEFSDFTKQSEFSSECSSSKTFFVFNAGDSSSTHTSSGSSGSDSSSRAISLRFTTPQIIGFYQQIVPEDKSEIYPENNTNDKNVESIENNIVKFIKAYEDVIDGRLQKEDNKSTENNQAS